jgi:hypothetical protein
MKKEIFVGMIVLAIATIAVFNVNLNTNSEVSLLTLANVEALAQESTDPCAGNTYHSSNQILEQKNCITAGKQNGTMLSCVDKSGRCCDPTKQTHCQ